MLLPEFALLLAFGADAGQDTCATKSDVQDLSTLVDETKGVAAAARAQAAIAPQGSRGFAGLYKMAENASEIHYIANMKQIGVVGPGDWCARPHRPNAPATSHHPPDAHCPPHALASFALSASPAGSQGVPDPGRRARDICLPERRAVQVPLLQEPEHPQRHECWRVHVLLLHEDGRRTG